MKTQILEAGLKYHIGGLPQHRVEEHLVAIKALVSRSCNTPKGGAIVKLVDIKFFSSSESIRGEMNTLHEANIPPKASGAWFKLNSQTRVTVKTPAGQTEHRDVGELVGQGSGGAALAS